MRRPTPNDVEQFHAAAESTEPNYPADGRFHDLEQTYEVGAGERAFQLASAAMREWAMHAGAGVDAHGPPPAEGSTVTLTTRVGPIWLLFACRVTQVTDSDDRYGFTYATLPGHPEQGEETFMATREPDGNVRLRISATSRPGMWLTRLAGPVGPVLQRRAMNGYADAVRAAIRIGAG